jgi:hypothetical protein
MVEEGVKDRLDYVERMSYCVSQEPKYLDKFFEEERLESEGMVTLEMSFLKPGKVRNMFEVEKISLHAGYMFVFDSEEQKRIFEELEIFKMF